MRLGELWRAACAGDVPALEAAYLHRVHRERGRFYLKGIADVTDDWGTVIGVRRDCEVLADLGDAALVRVGERHWHHWVAREDGRIAREVLVAEDGPALAGEADLAIERELSEAGGTARLAHQFIVAADGTSLRQVVSRFEVDGEVRVAVGEAVANG